MSIGVDYTPGQWRVCCVEQDRGIGFYSCATVDELQSVVQRLSASSPQPAIVIALDVMAPFSLLALLKEEQLDQLLQRYHPSPTRLEVRHALEILRSLSPQSYCAPSVDALPTVPLYRRFMRPSLGNARDLCAIVALLHHMHMQEAAWPEMNFFYINASESGTCVIVIEDGQVSNGIGTLQGSSLPAAYSHLAVLESAGEAEGSPQHVEFQQALSEAYWEGLIQDLSGLIALHHSEELVVLGQRSSELAERLADTYQIYLFPRAHTEHDGYESALGAALLAEGLMRDGYAADVVEHLSIRQARHITSLPGL